MIRTILYVESGSGYGGSAQGLYQLLTTIDRARFRPVVVAYGEGSAIQKIRELGVPVHVVPGVPARSKGYGHLLASWIVQEIPRAIRLMRLMRRERVDVVHLNTDIYSTVAGLWAARWMRRPVICHIRLTRSPTRLERWLGRWAQAKIVLTKEAQTFYQRWWPTDRIMWIPSGVGVPDLSDTRQDGFHRALNIPDGHRVVGLVARCVPGKGYEEFLTAAKTVSAQVPAVTFVIVGNGRGGDDAYEARMKRLAQTLGLNGAVIWAGWQTDATALYRSLDIVAQASSTFPEGLSMVPLEAMAHGRAVIATDIVGNRESVVHGETGLLVPPGNAQALAEAMLTLVRDQGLLQRYGTQGRRRVEAYFSRHAEAERITHLYTTLCEDS